MPVYESDILIQEIHPFIIQIFSTNVGQSTFSLLRKKKKKKYNHFKTFLKHLTRYTIDFIMKKHHIFDKTLMKT